VSSIQPYYVGNQNFVIEINQNFGSQYLFLCNWFQSVFKHFRKPSATLAQPESLLQTQYWSFETTQLELFSKDKILWFKFSNIGDVPTPDDRGHIEAEITIVNYLTSHFDNMVWIHGACLLKDNNMIILAGKSGVGKTTLSLALLKYGFKLLTDDIFICDRSLGKAIPFPRCPKVRQGAVALLKNLGLDFSGTALLDNYLILPDKHICPEPINLTNSKMHLFFIETKNDSTSNGASVSSLDRSSAIIRLAHQSNLLSLDSELTQFNQRFSDNSFSLLQIDTLAANVQQVLDKA